MKILVTGANGFLGSHIVEYLCAQGKEVTCLVRPSADLTHLKPLKSVNIIKCDFADQSLLSATIADVDIIIHCAGLTMARNSKDLYAINVGVTETLLECAAQHARRLQRFVFVSGLAAAGPSPNGKPLSYEMSSISQPVSHYGQSKLNAELKVQSYADKFPITIVRPGLIYGPRDIRTFVFFKVVQDGMIPLLWRGKGNYSIVYVTDVAEAICKSAFAAGASCDQYYIDGGKSYSLREFYSQIISTLSPRFCFTFPVPLLFLTPLAWMFEQMYRFNETKIPFTRDKVKELKQRDWFCDSGKTQRELGWYPQVSLSAGVKQSCDWYKNAGWLRGSCFKT